MNLLDYIKGFRKGKDAHRLELEAMNDPFLAEAMDGYNSVAGDHMARIAEMQRQIDNRTKSHGHKLWIPYASAAVVLIAAIYLTVLNNNPNSEYEENADFYVYVPSTFSEKGESEIRVYNEKISIAAEKEKIDIYIPSDFTEKVKNKDITEIAKTPAVIVNLEEVLVSDEIDIYIPETFTEKEKENSTPKVIIKNTNE